MYKDHVAPGSKLDEFALGRKMKQEEEKKKEKKPAAPKVFKVKKPAGSDLMKRLSAFEGASSPKASPPPQPMISPEERGGDLAERMAAFSFAPPPLAETKVAVPKAAVKEETQATDDGSNEGEEGETQPGEPVENGEDDENIDVLGEAKADGIEQAPPEAAEQSNEKVIPDSLDEAGVSESEDKEQPHEGTAIESKPTDVHESPKVEDLARERVEEEHAPVPAESPPASVTPNEGNPDGEGDWGWLAHAEETTPKEEAAVVVEQEVSARSASKRGSLRERMMSKFKHGAPHHAAQ